LNASEKFVDAYDCTPAKKKSPPQLPIAIDPTKTSNMKKEGGGGSFDRENRKQEGANRRTPRSEK